MIYADKEKLYVERGDMQKMLETLNLGEVGLYLTIKSLSIDNPDGIDEIKILESSPADGVDGTRKLLKGLFKKDYIQRINNKIQVTPRELE